MSMTEPDTSSRSRNLRRIATLRVLMATLSSLALLATHHLADTALQFRALTILVATLGIAGILTWLRAKSPAHITDHEFFVQLCIDVLLLALLLYFTGGATNPMAWAFLIPLTIAATVLPAPAVWSMTAITILCYSLLFFYYQPLGGDLHVQHDPAFSRHVFGMWFGFGLAATLIAWAVMGMANTLRERDRLLARAREQALRDEKLVALATLATGAAHELGTPLATMAVVTHELEQAQLPPDVIHKLGILRGQIDRCKQALSVISASSGKRRVEDGCLRPAREWLHSVVEAWKSQRPGGTIELYLPDVPLTPGKARGQAMVMDERTLRQAMINLINNAADAAPSPPKIEATLEQDCLCVDILDQGPGIHPGPDGRAWPAASSKSFGLGLGLFLSHASLQRLGGQIELLPRKAGGTRTHVRIPLTWTDAA